MRILMICAMAISGGCATAPKPADPTKDAAYSKAVEQLASMARDADALFKAGKSDEAAALIEKAQPVQKRVLDVPHPTLEAAEAASDLDDLYARMLFSNRHYGWARLLYQKNRARWKNWSPQTEETARRLKQADEGIAECDRHIEQ